MAKVDVFMDDIRDIPRYMQCGSWIVQRKVRDVVELLKRGMVNNLSLDHDMGTEEPTGYDLLCWMERENIWPDGSIDVHSANPVGAEKMFVVIKKHFDLVDKK